MKVNTNISIDANLKKEAVKLFSEFGLDLSTAISLFLSQSVREQRIPFEIKKEVSNKTTMDAIKEVVNMEGKRIKSKTYKNVDSLINDLTK